MLLGLFFIVLLLLLFLPYAIELNYKKNKNYDRFLIRLRIWKLKITIPTSFIIKVGNYWLSKTKQRINLEQASLLSKIETAAEPIINHPVFKYLRAFISSQLAFPIEIQLLELKLRYGLGDAAITGMVAGIFWGGITGGFALIRNRCIFLSRPVVRIVPVFAPATMIDVDFVCIFRIRLGYIITEYIKHLVEKGFQHMGKGGLKFGRKSSN